MKYLSLLFLILAACTSSPKILQVREKKITIQGKESTIYTLTQPDGTHGLTLKKGEPFHVVVENHLNIPTAVHWHGLILPNDQDGVPFITQFPIYPSERYEYRFPIKQSGTYWMHAHYCLQAQKLYASPLIIQDPHDSITADQEVVLLLSDFTFTSPDIILSQLKCSREMDDMMVDQDLIDVVYDAFLVNYRPIEDPDLIQVAPGSRVRLRIINGSASTNFYINTLPAEAIAVDGHLIQPVSMQKFELAAAQRVDLLVTIPEEGGAFPFLAIGEGTSMQGGAILYTPGSEIPTLSSALPEMTGGFTYTQEMKLHALTPLSTKEPDQRIEVTLGGNMMNYTWTINGQAWPEVTPLLVQKGKRVEITMKNESMMSHPMHLHGHVFQITAIDGAPVQGPLQDTALVLPNTSVSIQFDTDYPGVWPFHCHLLYHQEAGMFTVLRYADRTNRL